MNPYYLHDDPELGEPFGPYFNHEYLTYFSVIANDELKKLKPVAVKPNPNFGDFVEGPKHIDLYKEDYKLVRKVNSKEAVDPCIRNSDFSETVPVNKEIEPWKIIVLYTTEPDMHIDCDLELNPMQKLTKGSHGFRHMQFKIGWKTIGIPDQCFSYYFNSAVKAYKMGNEYWGYRFLSRAIHYVADLGHPFHIKVAPGWDLFKSLFNFKKAFKIFAAAHSGHEVYTQMRFRSSFLPFKEELMKGSKEGFASTEKFQKQMKKYRKHADKQLNRLYKLLIRGFGQKLIGAYDVVDKYKDLDSSKTTSMAENEAASVIFADPDNPILLEMDQITNKLVYNVGYMYGMVFRDFFAQKNL